MEKKQYIRPLTEVITNDYLCEGETINWSQEGEDAAARETVQFMEEDTNGKSFGYRRYNLWED